jgi:hypothetical protein
MKEPEILATLISYAELTFATSRGFQGLLMVLRMPGMLIGCAAMMVGEVCCAEL